MNTQRGEGRCLALSVWETIHGIGLLQQISQTMCRHPCVANLGLTVQLVDGASLLLECICT